MIKKLKSELTHDLLSFMNRIVLFNSVFSEYVHTMDLIHENKALMDETFSSLSVNYRKNVCKFTNEMLTIVKGLHGKIGDDGVIVLSNAIAKYIECLNNVWTCADFEKNKYDIIKKQQLSSDISKAKEEICEAFRFVNINCA